MKKQVEIFTDGACKGNPGPGGWGVVLRHAGKEKTLSGAVEQTTNNRMEMLAAIEGLKALKSSCIVHLTTDSQYLRQGITQWVNKWQHNGWQTANKKPVKNQDLWQTLMALVSQHDVQWHWVKGHAGHRENELADTLATQAITVLLEER